jgi:hypothetical protein
VRRRVGGLVQVDDAVADVLQQRALQRGVAARDWGVVTRANLERGRKDWGKRKIVAKSVEGSVGGARGRAIDDLYARVRTSLSQPPSGVTPFPDEDAEAHRSSKRVPHAT